MIPLEFGQNTLSSERRRTLKTDVSLSKILKILGIAVFLVSTPCSKRIVTLSLTTRDGETE